MTEPEPSDIHVVAAPVAEAGATAARPRRPRRWAVFGWVAAIVAAYVLGYVIGGTNAHGRSAARGAPGTTLIPYTAGAVHWGGDSCAASDGTVLTVGMQIANDAPVRTTLTSGSVAIQGQPGVVLLGKGWTDCGDTSAGTGRLDLPPGQRAWISARMDTKVPCPPGLRITFDVGYVLDGHAFELPPTGPAPQVLACPS